ncbi:MFS transporter [Archangium sp.]|jgi:MFS family permease|uniref:MFS transporter n=1 Tax=Archangium sp. TaxID=1872627 RepID=UPI002EDB4858
MSATPSNSALRIFLVTWVGRLVSYIGSGLSSFALSLHVYQSSGSITQFSLTSFSYFLPQLVLSPVAGALVDRWDRRRVMLLADLGAGLGTLSSWLLVAASEAGHWKLQNWHLYLTIGLGACFASFRAPAFQATTALLMPKRHLARANSLLELAAGTGQIVAPVVAGALLGRIGLSGILLIDLSTLTFAMGSLLLVRFPAPPRSEEGQRGRGQLSEEIATGWRFIRSRPGLLRLLAFVAVANLNTALVLVLLTPLALSFTDAATLGALMSSSGMGMMIGSIAMGVWGGPRRRMLGVIGFHVLAGVSLLAACLPPHVVLLGGAVFFFLFSVPVVSSCAQAIWQTKVPADMQGRVFAVRRMVALVSPPVAALVAGPLADRYFEPWMAPGGALAGTVGRVMGTGPGRGIALLLVVLGTVILVNAVTAWLSPAMRNVEEELPDTLPEPSVLRAA